jgi:hypothetical protein
LAHVTYSLFFCALKTWFDSRLITVLNCHIF